MERRPVSNSKVTRMRRRTQAAGWADMIPESQWRRYRAAIQRVREAGIDFALGGGFGVAAFTGGLKSTKDIDLYIAPDDREAMIGIVTEQGFADYYPQAAYDRKWIYRSCDNEGNILDLIWSMPNARASVDRRWVTEGPEIEVRGERLRVLPPEEMIWAKLYVLQRDRSDWPDIFNLLDAVGTSMDWEVLLERVEDDAALLGAALTVFAWLSPAKAREFPEWIWERMNIGRPGDDDQCCESRANLLDTRDWFRPVVQRRKAS